MTVSNLSSCIKLPPLQLSLLVVPTQHTHYDTLLGFLTYVLKGASRGCSATQSHCTDSNVPCLTYIFRETTSTSWL